MIYEQLVQARVERIMPPYKSYASVYTSHANLACLPGLIASISKMTIRLTKEGESSDPLSHQECHNPLGTLPWTACHRWNTGSPCGPSVSACGAAACRDDRKPCRILYTGKSFPNGNCAHVSSPGSAEHKKVHSDMERTAWGMVSGALSNGRGRLGYYWGSFLWTESISMRCCTALNNSFQENGD